MPLTDPPAAGPLTVAAGGGHAFARIGDAVAAASDGSTIHVHPGRYAEVVRLSADKRLIITGVGDRDRIVLDAGPGQRAALMSAAATATVSNLTIAGLVVTAGGLLVEGCVLGGDVKNAVTVEGALTRPTIRRCDIRNDADVGVMFWKDAAGTLEDCQLSGKHRLGRGDQWRFGSDRDPMSDHDQQGNRRLGGGRRPWHVRGLRGLPNGQGRRFRERPGSASVLRLQVSGRQRAGHYRRRRGRHVRGVRHR